MAGGVVLISSDSGLSILLKRLKIASAGKNGSIVLVADSIAMADGFVICEKKGGYSPGLEQILVNSSQTLAVIRGRSPAELAVQFLEDTKESF